MLLEDLVELVFRQERAVRVFGIARDPAEALVVAVAEASRKRFPSSMEQIPARRISLTRRSWSVR
jgi:hypothetical protein